MANKSANVTAAKPKIGGAIFRAPLGTELPKNATEELTDAFVNLGYVSEDGVTNNNAISSEQVKEWGGTVVLTTQSDSEDTFAFKLIESMNPDVLKTVYGENNVSGTLETGMTVNVNADEMTPYIWVIDMILKGGFLRRIVIPNGTVSERGEVAYVANGAIGYDITITAAADGTGNTHYEYTQKKTAGNV